MVEKRYLYNSDDDGGKIIDFKENNVYFLKSVGDFWKIEDLLNVQYDKIIKLEEDNNEIIRLRKENQLLREQLSQRELSKRRWKEYNEFWAEKIRLSGV